MLGIEQNVLTFCSRRPGISLTADVADLRRLFFGLSSSAPICGICGSKIFQLKMFRRTVFQLTP